LAQEEQMDDRTMRFRILRVLEAIDFEQRERWARRIVCSSLGATALALGLSGCWPPGPMPSREPAPIAQPDLGGCPNCEYAAPMPILPIDNGPKPKYAADIDMPRPAYAVVYPAQPPSIAVPPSNAEYAAPFEREPQVYPALKYGIATPQTRPTIKNEPVARYAIMTPRE
jgi:hypothetical protein